MLNETINKVNQEGGFKNLLKKALTSASGVGEALVPQHLERIITNAVQKLSPTISMIKGEYSPQKKHEFNRITDLGDAGGAMGEVATMTSTNSTYERTDVTLKIVRRQGSVSDFLQQSSEGYIDALVTEIENQVRMQAYGLESYLMFGNANADTYQFSGWDRLISTYRNNDGFSAGLPTVPANLQFLDKMIDSNIRNGGNLHEKVFIMSPEMLSLISRLLTNVRLNQGMDGLGKVMVQGGWRLNAYRDIPIIPSTFVGGSGAGTMTTVTAASGGTTGGSLSDGSYYFRVAPVTANGEEMASAEATVTLSGGTATQKINLTFSAFSGAISYKIYGATSTGIANSLLIDWQAAKTYDSNGTITGNNTTLVVLSMTATSNVSNMTSDRPLTAVSSVKGESIFLIDLDKYQGLGKFPYNNPGGREGGIVSVEQLAKTKPATEFLIYTHGALCPSFERTSAVSRGWRVA